MKFFTNNLSQRPQAVSAGLFILTALIASLLIRAYDINRIQQIHSESELKTLTALSQFCAEQIQKNWGSENNNIDILMSGLQYHTDVSQSFLTNHLAGILSPKSRALEIVNDPNIEQLLTNNELALITTNKDSKLQVFNRIDTDGEVNGVLVLEKIVQFQDIKFFSLGFILRTILICVVALIFSILSSRIWVKPWLQLHDEFDLALQTGKLNNSVKYNNELVDSHRTLYSRYLMKLKKQH